MELSKIFFKLSENDKISREELYECGADDEYIEYALENDILATVDDSINEFKVGDVEVLVDYGKYILDNNGDYKTANSIFECAYVTDFSNYEVNYQLLCQTVKNRKNKAANAFKYFDVICNKLIEDGDVETANFYLFLLGSLYDLPGRYKEKFINLELGDILLTGVDNTSREQNEVRKGVFENVYYRVETNLQKQLNTIFYSELEKELLLKWLERKNHIDKLLNNCIRNDDIEGVKTLLDSEDEKRNLSKTNQYILKVVNSYLMIKENEIIPKSKYYGNDTFSAIDGNNYKLALELSEKFNKEQNIKKETKLHIILRKTVVLIDSIMKKEEKQDIDPFIQKLIDRVEKVRSKDELINVLINRTKEVRGKKKLSLDNKEKQRIDAKAIQMENGERMVFLLDPMPKEKRDLVREYIKNKGYDEFIAAFSIGDDSKKERRLVLKYKERMLERVNFEEELMKAKEYYAKEDYVKALERYGLVIKVGKPWATTYSGYGMTLYRLGRNKEAVDCLRTATIMSKTESNGKIDFTDMIERIENPPERENRKPMVVVNESEFEDKQNSKLSEELKEGIITLIKDGGMKLEDACKEFNLNESTTNYIKLIYARDNYYLGNNSVAEKYFKQVEKSKEKDAEVKKLFKDIQRDKKYYHNRYDENSNQLVLIKK